MATDIDTSDRVVAPLAVADPAPLGLAGFALTTFLLSGANAQLLTSSPGADVWIGMAFFYGGLAQFAAGMWEFKNRNTFGATAFSSFGAFWMGLAIMIVFSAFNAKATYFAGEGIIWFFFIWAVFTTYMFVGSLRVTGAVALVFLLLALTFWVLWIGALSGSTNWTKIAGYLGLATAAVAFYASFAGVVNSTFGRVVLPVFPMNTT
jgi:uncharacterized protein